MFGYVSTAWGLRDMLYVGFVLCVGELGGHTGSVGGRLCADGIIGYVGGV